MTLTGAAKAAHSKRGRVRPHSATLRSILSRASADSFRHPRVPRGRGGIGRRIRFRILRLRCAGSSPVARTNTKGQSEWAALLCWLVVVWGRNSAAKNTTSLCCTKKRRGRSPFLRSKMVGVADKASFKRACIASKAGRGPVARTKKGHPSGAPVWCARLGLKPLALIKRYHFCHTMEREERMPILPWQMPTVSARHSLSDCGKAAVSGATPCRPHQRIILPPLVRKKFFFANPRWHFDF